LQPEGLIRADTLWRACWGEPLPAALQGAPMNKVAERAGERMAAAFKEAAKDLPYQDSTNKVFRAIVAQAEGVKMASCLQSVTQALRLTLEDISGSPGLYSLVNLPSLDAAENELAMDINRLGFSDGLPGYTPSLTLTTANGDSRRIDLMNTDGMTSEDAQDLKNGKPSSKTRQVRKEVLQLCGDNELQARVVLMGLGQAGAAMIRELSSLTGVPRNEHSPVHLEVARRENGDMSVHYSTPENSPLRADYTFIVKPDGNSFLDSLIMEAAQ
jgi:hypothetical protein